MIAKGDGSISSFSSRKPRRPSIPDDDLNAQAASYATAEEERMRLSRASEAQEEAARAMRRAQLTRLPALCQAVRDASDALLPVLDTLEGEVGEHEEALSTALLHCELLADKLRSQVGERSQVGATAVASRAAASPPAKTVARGGGAAAAASVAAGRKVSFLGPGTIPEDGAAVGGGAARLPAAATSEGERKADFKQRRKKANTTDSMYTVGDSSLTRPNADEIIFSVSCYLHDRVVSGEAHLQGLRNAGAPLPPLFHDEKRGDGEATLDDVPSEEEIFGFLQPIYEQADFSAECFVVILVYLERLFVTGHVPPLVSNWQAIVFTALVLGAKVWDDTGSSNADFSAVTNELFSLKALNKMEAQYLSLIQYNVTVNSSLYASCYFELRALCEKEEQGFPIKPLGVLEAKRLEERSGAMFKKERNHRAKSTDALALAARGPEPLR